jgi:RNA polymerase sigma-70 factor (ECF subfamily)
MTTARRLDADLATEFPRLRAMAMRFGRSADEGGDVLQEALVRALQNADSLPRGNGLITWMNSVMRNLAIDRWRRRGREVLEAPGFFCECAAANDPAPEPPWATLTSDQLRAAAERLTPSFRDVFQLHLVGESNQAIARRLAIPVGTVATRLFRARRKLRALLESELGAQRLASAASAERA